MVGYCAGSCPGHSIWVNYKIMATMAAAPTRASLEILAEQRGSKIESVRARMGVGGRLGRLTKSYSITVFRSKYGTVHPIAT